MPHFAKYSQGEYSSTVPQPLKSGRRFLNFQLSSGIRKSLSLPSFRVEGFLMAGGRAENLRYPGFSKVDNKFEQLVVSLSRKKIRPFMTSMMGPMMPMAPMFGGDIGVFGTSIFSNVGIKEIKKKCSKCQESGKNCKCNKS